MTTLKVGLLIAVGFVTGASALALRQQQLQATHDMAQSYRQIDQTRRSIWVMQAMVAQKLDPARLLEAVRTQSPELDYVGRTPWVDASAISVASAGEPGTQP